MNYFSFTPVDGFQFHNTAEESRLHTNAMLTLAQEDRVSVDFCRFCCGEITHLSCETPEAYNENFALNTTGFELKPIGDYDGE